MTITMNKGDYVFSPSKRIDTVLRSTITEKVLWIAGSVASGTMTVYAATVAITGIASGMWLVTILYLALTVGWAHITAWTVKATLELFV